MYKRKPVISVQRHQLAAIIRKKSGFKYSKDDIIKIIDLMLESILESLADGKKVTFRNFGYFVVRMSNWTDNGFNPVTGEQWECPATPYPKFKASIKFKQYIKENYVGEEKRYE